MIPEGALLFSGTSEASRYLGIHSLFYKCIRESNQIKTVLE